jgi:hypothetical protein
LIDLVLNGTINPGKVFDLTLPLEQASYALESTSSEFRIFRDRERDWP